MKFILRNFRFIIQTLFFVYILGIGARFYFYIAAVKLGDFGLSRPSGVEGFLPISALLGLRQLIFDGTYDKVHPAGLTILLAAIIMSALFKKSFCGYICPVGYVSEQVSKVGLKVKIHKYIHYPLTALKYAVLGFFIYSVFFVMNTGSAAIFIESQYNKVSDAKMLEFLISPSFTTVVVLLALALLTLVFKNFWCRYLCPYGALLGIVSFLSPFKIKRSETDCVKCGRCAKSCPMDIPVDERYRVVSPECFGCMNCIKNRYNDKCLSVGRFQITPVVYGLFAVGIFMVIFLAAYFGGFWESSVDPEEYREILRNIDSISH